MITYILRFEIIFLHLTQLERLFDSVGPVSWEFKGKLKNCFKR